MSYEIGKVYIWQNLSDDLAYLNGSECTVLGPVEAYGCAYYGGQYFGQPTDSYTRDDFQVMAEPGDLRPKNPPPGEKGILELFKITQRDEVPA